MNRDGGKIWEGCIGEAPIASRAGERVERQERSQKQQEVRGRDE